ncbi:MAG: NAD(P)/FAD-dependent oxidoreductase [Acidobacteriota bacterium]|nr:NAD(P)/FAD-dependent oxidoreductase [Acidobacteriota bacterium]
MQHKYDVVTVGGGIGGAALGRQLARQGATVLVLERESEFRDRVRGEVLVPWGVAEARELDLVDLLTEHCGHELRFWNVHLGNAPFMQRDLIETSSGGLGAMTFFHPEMQNPLLAAAQEAGAEVRRGARVSSVEPGDPAHVTYLHEGTTHEIEAGLVVGADGRSSATRRWGGFEVKRDAERRQFAGVLLDGVTAPDDAMHTWFGLGQGLIGYLFPQGGGRVRAYVGFHSASDFAALSGESDLPRFLETHLALGVPEDYLEAATSAGPLANFDATDNWVEEPYADGIALVGDAAATSDPTWGQGMSLTLRDVRILSAALSDYESTEAAGRAYAESHRAVYATCRRCEGWYTDLFLEIGPDSDALRAKALPLIAEDPTRIPDTPISGPECGADEAARQRFFGEA